MHDNLFSALTQGLVARTVGPLKFRFVLQPLMAMLLATRSGFRDALEGKPPFFWDYCADPSMRKVLFRDGWKAIGKLFIFACILDLIYQVIVLRRIYPFDALVIAFLLAIVPYVVMRGPVNRIVTRTRKLSAPSPTAGHAQNPSRE